jgi:hypothetical protein
MYYGYDSRYPEETACTEFGKELSKSIVRFACKEDLTSILKFVSSISRR